MMDDEDYGEPEDFDVDPDDFNDGDDDAFEEWLKDVQNMQWDKIKGILDDDLPTLGADHIMFSIDRSAGGDRDPKVDIPEDEDMIDIFRKLIITAYGQEFSDDMEDHQIMGLLEKISHITGIDKEDIIIAIQEGSAGIDQVFGGDKGVHPSLDLRDSERRNRDDDDFIKSVQDDHKSSRSPGSPILRLVVDDVVDDVLDDEVSNDTRIEQLDVLDNMLRAEHDPRQVARIAYLRQLMLRED